MDAEFQLEKMKNVLEMDNGKNFMLCKFYHNKKREEQLNTYRLEKQKAKYGHVEGLDHPEDGDWSSFHTVRVVTLLHELLVGGTSRKDLRVPLMWVSSTAYHI